MKSKRIPSNLGLFLDDLLKFFVGNIEIVIDDSKIELICIGKFFFAVSDALFDHFGIVGASGFEPVYPNVLGGRKDENCACRWDLLFDEEGTLDIDVEDDIVSKLKGVEDPLLGCAIVVVVNLCPFQKVSFADFFWKSSVVRKL